MSTLFPKLLDHRQVIVGGFFILHDMPDLRSDIVHEASAIQAMHPEAGTIDMVLAFLRLQLLMGELKFTATDQKPYAPAWNTLLNYASPELNMMLMYHELGEEDMMTTAKYIAAFRRLQYLVGQAVALLP